MPDVPPLIVRAARTHDVRSIRDLVEPLARARVLVSKDAVAYYEGLQQFVVAEARRRGRRLRRPARAVGRPCRGAHARRRTRPARARRRRGAARGARRPRPRPRRLAGVLPDLRDRLLRSARLRRDRGRTRRPGRLQRACCARTTRAWPSSSTSTA
nr:hypothetical protein [Angustibacter aerolatus]